MRRYVGSEKAPWTVRDAIEDRVIRVFDSRSKMRRHVKELNEIAENEARHVAA